jgi:dienelactone hydrolase
MMSRRKERERLVDIAVKDHSLEGDFGTCESAEGIVLFAHGTGENRRRPQNQRLNGRLQEDRFNTLLMDLLTPEEKAIDIETRRPRFDIERLGERIVHVVDWLGEQPENQDLKLGCLASSTAAAAALVAAEARPKKVQAVVALEGRIDIAASILDRIRVPTLCIVGECDLDLVALNRRALKIAQAEKQLEIIKRATHIFKASETFNDVIALTRDWFLWHLASD